MVRKDAATLAMLPLKKSLIFTTLAGEEANTERVKMTVGVVGLGRGPRTLMVAAGVGLGVSEGA